MKRKYIIMALIVSATSVIFAQGVPGETKTVTAIGVGASQKAAETAAIRSAVMIAVGEFIDTETLVKNGKLVNDKILSYSSGYVESYKQIGSPRALEGGLLEVKILAQVRRTSLKKKVTETILKPTAQVDGNSLFAELVTKQDQWSNAKEMVNSAFEDLPLKVLEANVVSKKDGKPNFTFDPDTRELCVPVCLSVNKDKYARMVAETVEKVELFATYKTRVVEGFDEDFKYEKRYKFESIKRSRNGNRGGSLLLVENLKLRTGRYYEFDHQVASELSKWFGRTCPPFNILLTVSLLDQKGEALTLKKLPLRTNRKDNIVMRSDYLGNWAIVPLPFFQMMGNSEYYIEMGWHTSSPARSDREYEIFRVSFGEVDPDVLKKAVRLECRLEMEYTNGRMRGGR